MIVDGQDIQVGMIIQFRSINAKDPNLIQGVVMALCDYPIAKTFSDVVKYNQEVLESNPTSEPDPTVLHYMIIKDEQGVAKAYAITWVEPTTLRILDTTNDIKIIIYDTPNTETETILKLLRDNGYKSAVLN